jgi:hypothetical protein
MPSLVPDVLLARNRPRKATPVTAAQTQTYSVVPTKNVGPRDGVDDVYREIGSGSVPLVPLRCFRGNLDNWDLRSSMHWTPHSPKVLARNGFDGMSGEEWL